MQLTRSEASKCKSHIREYLVTKAFTPNHSLEIKEARLYEHASFYFSILQQPAAESSAHGDR